MRDFLKESLNPKATIEIVDMREDLPAHFSERLQGWNIQQHFSGSDCVSKYVSSLSAVT